MTNEEKQAIEDFKADNLAHGENELGEYEMTGYLSRQPRYNLRNKNFNFEEFNKYTQLYEEARAKDENES